MNAILKDLETIQSYKGTFNHFTKDTIFPGALYNPKWENSNLETIAIAYDQAKKDAMFYLGGQLGLDREYLSNQEELMPFGEDRSPKETLSTDDRFVPFGSDTTPDFSVRKCLELYKKTFNEFSGEEVLPSGEFQEELKETDIMEHKTAFEIGQKDGTDYKKFKQFQQTEFNPDIVPFGLTPEEEQKFGTTPELEGFGEEPKRSAK